MEIELNNLDLRFEKLRKRNARHERQLLASLSEHGQLLPVVVVRGEARHAGAESTAAADPNATTTRADARESRAPAGTSSVDPERLVLLDGYKRVRALRRLASDTVRATTWDLAPADALLLERLMRSGQPDSPIEQGWLLVTLRTEFGLSLDELARRFDRTKSWVSRRLALVEQLPDLVQERVRTGLIAPYAAMKFFVPLARANKAECVRLATALARPLSIRQVEALCAGFKAGDAQARARLCADPDLYLRAVAAAREDEDEPLAPGQRLVRDAAALAGIARRLTRNLRDGQARLLEPTDRAELARAVAQARHDTAQLFAVTDAHDAHEKELPHARPEHSPSHPGPA